MIMGKIKSGKLRDSYCLEKGKIKLLHLSRYFLFSKQKSINIILAKHSYDTVNVLCRKPLKIQALRPMVPGHMIL
jgi:hypothetical protein